MAAAILLYVAALTALRLSLSPFLELDEAQFMGAVDLRLVYGNSHPPLYNWLVRGALELTGWNWPLSVALVRAALLAATHLLLFDAARRVAGVPAGVLAVACALLMPQIAWMSAHTLAHSLLAMAASAGVLHALVLIAERPRPAAFLWLGLAAAASILGKPNVILLLAALAAAAATLPAWRARFARRSALVAPAVAVPLVAPALAAAALDLAASTERVAKLYREGPYAILDIPVLGLDGLVALAVATLASGGIVLALLALTRTPAAPGDVAPLLRRTLLLGLAGTAVLVLAADTSYVHERYLTPLLMPLPLLAALHLAGWSRRGWVVASASLAAVAVLAGMVGMVLFDKHRWARPYPAFAAAIAAKAPAERLTVASEAQDLAANVVLALRREGREAVLAGDALADPGPVHIWLGGSVRSEPPTPAPGLCRTATVRTDAPLLNWTGRTMGITAAIDAPCPANAARPGPTPPQRPSTTASAGPTPGWTRTANPS